MDRPRITAQYAAAASRMANSGLPGRPAQFRRTSTSWCSTAIVACPRCGSPMSCWGGRRHRFHRRFHPPVHGRTMPRSDRTPERPPAEGSMWVSARWQRPPTPMTSTSSRASPRWHIESEAMDRALAMVPLVTCLRPAPATRCPGWGASRSHKSPCAETLREARRSGPCHSTGARRDQNLSLASDPSALMALTR